MPANHWPNFVLVPYIVDNTYYDHAEWLYIFPDEEKLRQFYLSGDTIPCLRDIIVVDFDLYKRLVEE